MTESLQLGTLLPPDWWLLGVGLGCCALFVLAAIGGSMLFDHLCEGERA